MPFWAYRLRCSDGSYNTGYTENLEKRLWQHQNGIGCGCTMNRRLVKLAFHETFPTRIEALTSERRIKGWSRKKKEALIRGDWDEISRLSRSRKDGSVRPSTELRAKGPILPGENTKEPL
jgi:predicted GIY-YIG superfamily endonuclease